MMSKFLLSVSAVALLGSAPAFAQATTAPADEARADTSGGEGEIVVTAERRTTNLQRASVAATVLTAEDLVHKSVNNVEGLQFATPSLTVNTTGQGNAFNIRGIGKTEQTSAIGVGVITYRDGVATLPGYFQSEPYYDIASVEVLRGPQGTFAGGNATGGAVFITQQNPTFDRVGGYLLAQYGNYDHMKLQGALNIPSGDTLAIRFAGNMERRDTFYDVSGPWTGNPGNRRDYSGRISIAWEPTPELRILLKGDYNNIEYGGLPAGNALETGDPLKIANNAHLSGRDEFGRIVLNAQYKFASGLTLRSISGFQRGTTQISYDADGTATILPALSFRDNITEEIWSQEFNIISPDTGPFTWMLGGYYQHDKITIPENGGYYSDATPNTPTALDIEIVGTNPKTALAAFGQVGYELTDGLQITVGGRWSRSTSANDAEARAYFTGIPGPILTLPQVDRTVNKKVNGKIAINWTVNPDHFLYAFVATGSKAGGLNGPNILGRTPLAFDAEDVTDFEAGWKGTFADGHIRTQIGGYYNIYKNFQVNIVDPRITSISSIYNVPGKTKLYGIEASMQGSFDAFSFDFATSVSDSKLGTFYAIDPRIPVVQPTPACDVAGPANGRCLELTGNEQNYAPKFTLSAGAQYKIPLGSEATLTPRVDFAHIAATWASLFQNRALGDRLEDRNILNAQLTLTTGDWSIAAYGTNLTNQHYVAAINGARRLAGAPRQYGLRVSRNF
ncbi:iron complex outermembrane receptor protein [Sphingopyxis panaciterrae]|uniref:TonB-dependent receptor n=1 Tax=Sphingopyxis panaciterrae TaxID=363841 RepID=UPI00141E17E3|nr:TonB-dependent receptor [Sphingopyxis panaciterrae]NIJ38259.1 iron complex outermembrane receptor protein [Sphingopyxis panaciterrae]